MGYRDASDTRRWWQDRPAKMNVRVGGRRGPSPEPPVRFILAVVALAGLLVGGWLTWRWCSAVLFARNPAYRIANLEIRGGGELATHFIREIKGLNEGHNLFGFDIGEIRDEFRRQRYASKYKSMEISRILPDTLRVEVTERVPLARVGRLDNLVVDSDGTVFGGGAGAKQSLPVITGYSGAPLKPGDRLERNLLDAVQVLDLCEKTGLGRDVAITGIDVSGGFAGRRDDLQLLVDGQTEVLLWWPRHEARGASPEDLRERLIFLRAILLRARQEGKRLRTVNMTLETYKNNCPVTFY